ncbi:hypothetical protein [Desulforhopalus sp. IMCC35007]|uniref:hypothetical protein n=1 Tax=Desulforhopalus sp. IMCC35007 TaxID=2569543 RepID=UPI0010AE286F|nr:hypothetical protein [Desulforhopalus sp. IMCC35007]TKB08849.1 hypothetical protein FCL48_12550 [Desulforhopalus sp. IMCC35007]
MGPSYLEIIVIALIIAATAVTGYDRFVAHKIYVFDLKGYLRTQNALLLAGEITDKQWQTRLNAIEDFLDDEAVNPRHVILMGDIVLRNGKTVSLKEQR